MSLSNNQRRTSLDSVHNHFARVEWNINRSKRSSTITPKRRVRFRSRDFIRCRSSTLIDLPSPILGKSISNRTAVFRDERKKSNAERLKNSSNVLLPTVSNKNEKKIITTHSMTKNMRLPPTATVVINQTYKSSVLTTTSTNNQLKKSNLNKDLLPSQRLLTARTIPSPFRYSLINSKPEFDLKIKSCHHTDDANHSSNE
jgi:hypothetical protein